jgi:hypothetical protein
MMFDMLNLFYLKNQMP